MLVYSHDPPADEQQHCLVLSSSVNLVAIS